ncbi:MAG: signal recognition particle receptor subunit alpha [Nanoarchaeota archaeon]|nr:signal recognition particle receptor subunit alpha [Nanoarchaeota archaeon]
MVLDKIGNALRDSFNKIKRSMLVDKKLIDEIVKDIQRALLQGDVNVKMVLDLSENIRKRAIDEKPPAGMTQKEYLVKVIYDELTKILGEKEAELKITRKKPFKIMMTGIFGSGKTTSIGKLAKYYSQRGYKIGVLGLDIHRPAAMEQIEQIGKKINVSVYTDKKEKNVTKIFKKFEKEYAKYDILIIDTAGRDALSDDLIKELKNLNKEVKPDEKILVISADIGQAAYEQAKAFHDAVEVTGIFVSKLDGTAKGGGALVGCAATKSKIYFVGVGEKNEDIEKFDPEGFVSRLLGMGDLKALLEKAREAISEEEAQDIGKKMLKGDFNLIDLYEQMKAMSKMGPLSKVLEMMPGMSQLKGKLPKEMISAQEEKLKIWKHIMNSMTKDELERPDEVLNVERIERIAKGSGTTTKDVRELVKQYKQSKKLMKMMKGQDPQKLMKKFRGKIPGLGF